VLAACTLAFDTQSTFGAAKRLVFQSTLATLLSQSLYQVRDLPTAPLTALPTAFPTAL
jgi:hypothetical protein